jgi:hypothetical protein
MKQNLNIWWKIAFASAVLDVVTLPVWIALQMGRVPKSFPLALTVPLTAFLALPVVYLFVFSLWHWRTRYAGRHHLTWPILFVLTGWPILSTLPGSVFTSLAYFFLHLLPDARGRGIYATPPVRTLAPPASPVPKKYQLAQSACFVLGWILVIGGLFAAAETCKAHFAIWNYFDHALLREVGKELTKAKFNALWVGSQTGKITVLACLFSALASAVGAGFIYVSQRLRWRLLDEQEKEELGRSI